MVLALLGLATALVAPAGVRTIETWRRATDVDAALGAVSALGARAHQTGKGMWLEGGAVPMAELEGVPDGWQVVLEGPLRIHSNGACTGTTGELRHDSGYVQPFVVSSPFCETRRLEPEGG